MSVSLLQLRYFAAVADEGGFTRAAERLGVAQPSLSAQIKSMERLLGIALFPRTTRRVELTPAGRALHGDVKRLIDEIDAAVTRAVRIGREPDAIRLAYTASAGYDALPRLMGEIDRDAPDTTVTALQGSHDDVLDAVRRGDADAGLVREFAGADGLCGEVVRDEPLVVFMSAAHPLADRASLRLDQLVASLMLTVPRELAPGFHDRVTGLCATRGFPPPAGELTAPGAREPLLAHLARNPDHVFVGPESMSTTTWPGVVPRPLSDADATLALSLVWAGDEPSPAAARVRAACAEVAARAGWPAARPATDGDED